jgi:hypothetical protein
MNDADPVTNNRDPDLINEVDDNLSNKEGYVDGDCCDPDDLSKHQRAVLEFFIAQFRVWSQKLMKYWALILPLVSYS